MRWLFKRAAVAATSADEARGFWRESDRVLICGDVLTNMNLFTTKVGLHYPPNLVTVDPARNRESARKATALEPDVVGFGHGPILTGAAPKLKAFLP